MIEDSIQALIRNNVNGMFYLENGSEDTTLDILWEYNLLSKVPVHIQSLNLTNPNWHRSQEPRYSSHVMGPLRQIWTHLALLHFPQATRLWSVDSDIIVPDNALQSLLSHNMDIIAARVPVGKTEIHMTAWDPDDKQAMRGEWDTVPDKYRCTLVGGCVLYSRAFAESGQIWGPHAQGEDGYFGDRARERGYEMWVDNRVICEHRMKQPENWKEF